MFDKLFEQTNPFPLWTENAKQTQISSFSNQNQRCQKNKPNSNPTTMKNQTNPKQERDGASRPISRVTSQTLRLPQPQRRLAPLGSCVKTNPILFLRSWVLAFLCPCIVLQNKPKYPRFQSKIKHRPKNKPNSNPTTMKNQTNPKQERDGASRPISCVTSQTLRLPQPQRRLAPLGSCVKTKPIPLWTLVSRL
jgi:hypothetical protein